MYRIWSSVLGAALTETYEDGQKKQTQVFAGGAVIATQVRYPNNSESVGWAMVDPLTGSSPSEELEAFGQQVDKNPPLDDSGPYAAAAPMPEVNEPEFMCGGQQNFWFQPAQCKIAILEKAGANFRDMLLTDDERNPARVARSNSGPPTLKAAEKLSKEEIARRKALAATGKFDNEEEDERLINMTTVSGNAASQTRDELNDFVSPHKPTVQSNHGLRNLERALDECTRMLFQVKVTSFRASEYGKAGNVNFNFTDPNRRLNGFMGFGVMNDVTTYSIRTAPEDVKKNQGRNQRVTGFTNSASPHINFTLSNIKNGLDIVKTQIHELGHSLQHITRNVNAGYPQYDEAGWTLENCVRDKGGFK